MAKLDKEREERYGRFLPYRMNTHYVRVCVLLGEWRQNNAVIFALHEMCTCCEWRTVLFRILLGEAYAVVYILYKALSSL
jgi:hypothetical protein